MDKSMEVANSPAIWVLAAIVVSIIIIQTAMFLRLAYKASKEKRVEVSRAQCNRALRAGIVSAIGPAFGVFVVMIGLIAVLGGPMSWMRLSTIGGATTELTAATVGVKAAGGDIASGALSMMELSTAWWTMVVNSCGWLIVVFFLGSRMEKVRTRIGGGDNRWMEIFSSAATLGIFGAFCSEFIVTGVQTADYKTIVATVVAGAAMWVFLTLSKKYRWISEYSLGLAMVVGLFAAIIMPV